MSIGHFLKAAVCGALVACAAWAGEDGALEIRRPSIGVRIEDFSTRMFDIESTQKSTTAPVADYSYTATSNSPKVGVAPTVEYRLTPRLSLVGELHFHHALYSQVTNIRNGQPDPAAGYDNRPVTTITESSKVNYWEIPILLHYYRLRQGGSGSADRDDGTKAERSFRTKVLLTPVRLAKPAIRDVLYRSYVSGGLEYRYVGKIRTGTEYSYADQTTDYNEIAAATSQRSQLGFVIGAGVRLNDDYIKIMPEVRFIHWQGVTLQGPAFHSASNQLEIGIGFSY
jgi:hypothetical protein